MPVNFSPQQLTGATAFYAQDDYETATRKELSSVKALAPVYECNFESRAWRITKLVFSIIIFPIGLYRVFHRLLGKLIVPASFMTKASALAVMRSSLLDNNDWKVKRISLKVDGQLIDAMIMGKESTLGNGRWTLYSNGNGQNYESMYLSGLENFLESTKSNALFFSYPGVGASQGLPSRNTMAKAYRAMLNFLEDQEKGIGAKDIIGYGFSLGGAVQAEGLEGHKLKEDIKYVFVKDRTFSNLGKVPGGFLGFLAKLAGWNMNCVKSSLKLKAPEIILQRHRDPGYIENQPQHITSDSVISPEASLAMSLLKQKNKFTGPKRFLGISEGHNDLLNRYTTDQLARMINDTFKAYPCDAEVQQPEPANAAAQRRNPIPTLVVPKLEDNPQLQWSGIPYKPYRGN